MFPGADDGHPGPGIAKPFVTGLVFSYDEGATRYAALTEIQQPRVEAIESLQKMMERALRRKVKGLTLEKLAFISDQIIAWANKSEKENDGRTLIQATNLIFEKSTDETTWSEMYAQFCRKMMEQISTNVQDDGIKNNEGEPITGSQLFRMYLLNRCQEDFECGWVAKEATAAAKHWKMKLPTPKLRKPELRDCTCLRNVSCTCSTCSRCV